jgi:hypothetical protein
MMKNLLKLFIVSLLIISFRGYAQEKSSFPNGLLFGKIFFDAYTQTGAGENATAMEIRRVYLGYKYNYDENFQAYIKLDIGSPYDLSPVSRIRRYAFFKNAGMKYHKDKLTVNAGITDVFMFTTQEKYWGHRYVDKMYLDKYKFGPKADIGANVKWEFSEKFSIDFGLYNGEGYKYLQKDNTYRGGLGITYYPLKSLVTRFYFDYTEKVLPRITYSAFVGYKFQKKFVFGFEYNYQQNQTFLKDHNLFGFSTYATWNFNEKWSVFSRYDFLKSNEITQNPWNVLEDGQHFIGGFQYVIHKGIVVAVNYRDWHSDSNSKWNSGYIFMNFEVKF